MNLRRASSYPPDILRRQIQLTEKHHLPGLLAAALVGSMVQLDYSMRSSLIGSVCAGSVDSRSVQEIPGFKDFRVKLWDAPDTSVCK